MMQDNIITFHLWCELLAHFCQFAPFFFLLLSKNMTTCTLSLSLKQGQELLWEQSEILTMQVRNKSTDKVIAFTSMKKVIWQTDYWKIFQK